MNKINPSKRKLATNRTIRVKYFSISIRLFNALWNRLMLRTIKILPSDLAFFRIADSPEYPDSIQCILMSKTFPEIKEGDKAPTGMIDIITNDRGECTQVSFL